MLICGYLHSIGVALPDEEGCDVPRDVSDDEGDDHGDGDDSGDDPDVADCVSVRQPSTSVANHTQLAPIDTGRGASVGSDRSGRVGKSRVSGKEKSTPKSAPSTPESAPESTPKSGDQSVTGQGNSEKSGNQPQVTYVNPPVPTVKPRKEVLPGPNINEKVRRVRRNLRRHQPRAHRC